MPFHIAAQTCEMLGALLTLGPRVKRAELTDAQWTAAGTAGLSILRDGPEALRQKLKEIQDSHPVGEKLYRSHYGVFFDWLRSRRCARRCSGFYIRTLSRHDGVNCSRQALSGAAGSLHGLILKQSEYGKRSTIYRLEDLDEFLERFRAFAKPDDATKDLIDISTPARRRGVTIASLAGIILDRRIPLYFESAYAEDFRAFRVHPGSLNGIYRRAQEPVASSWSVARLLKISRPTVYRLRQAGFLAPLTKRKSVSIRGGKYSCRKSLEEFQAAHVSLNELIERSGGSADDEFSHQISNGALPLPLGLRSTMIFRRADVD